MIARTSATIQLCAMDTPPVWLRTASRACAATTWRLPHVAAFTNMLAGNCPAWKARSKSAVNSWRLSRLARNLEKGKWRGGPGQGRRHGDARLRLQNLPAAGVRASEPRSEDMRHQLGDSKPLFIAPRAAFEASPSCPQIHTATVRWA